MAPWPISRKEAKDHHGEEGLNNRPSCTKDSLLVAYLDVPPGQKIEEFSIFPQFSELE
jgi:hypothetical protein